MCFNNLLKKLNTFGKSIATDAETLQKIASHRFNEMSPLDFFSILLCPFFRAVFKENKICLGCRLSIRLRESTCRCLFILIYAPSVHSLSTSKTLSSIFLEAPSTLMAITAFNNYVQAQI